MKTGKDILSNTLRTIVLSLCLILLATCDVGLGPSIDTNVPTVTISAPTPSQVVKGAFSFGGIATDDGEIAKIIVDFTGIGSFEGKNYNFEASFADGKWSLPVNTVGTVADGTYQLKVTANDKSGKTSYQMTTFTVDNTPPVILVTSPDEKIAEMDYDLQFEGKIYDATEIGSIKVTVYDAAGKEKVSKDASLIGTSEWKVSFDGQTELLIDTSLAKLTNDDYSYSVKASDKIGNSSTYFFHKEDIYKRYTNNRLSIDEWAAFDKGDSDKVSGVALDRNWLNTIRIPADPVAVYSERTMFTYSTDPVANIKWNIEKNSLSQLSENDMITGSITPPAGVDSPFKNDTFVARIWEIDTDSSNSEEVHEPSDSDTVLLYGDSHVTITNIGTSRSFSISLKGLNLSKGKHGISVQINNSSNKQFSDENQFGIDLGAPNLVVTNLKNLPKEVKQEDNFVYSGIALENDEKTPCELRYELTITDADGNVIYETPDQTPNDNIDGNNGMRITVNSDGTWTHSLNEDVTDANIGNYRDGTYSYVFTAVSGDYRPTKSHSIIWDKTPPVITTELDPDGNGVRKQSFNTTTNRINIECRDELSGVAKVSWYLCGPDENEYGSEHVVTTGNYANITFANEGTGQKLKFVVTDKVGNVTTKEYTEITVDLHNPELTGEGFAESAPRYIKKDDPSFSIIAPEAADSTIIASDAIAIESFEVTATKNGTPQTNTGYGDFWYKKAITGNELKVSDISVPSFAATTGNEGDWVVTATIKDKSGWSVSKSYSFTVDTTLPQIDTIEDIAPPMEMGTVSYMFSGTASDSGSGIKIIQVAFTDKGVTLDDNSAQNATGKTDWNYTLRFSSNSVFSTEGKKTIYVRAIDTAGNEGEWKSADFVYDKEFPTSSIISYTNDGTEYTTLTSTSFFTGISFGLKGKAYDSQRIEKVEVYQKIGEDSSASFVKIATITGDSNLPLMSTEELSQSDSNGTQSWTVANLPREISVSGEATENASVLDGKYTYYADVTDKSGKTVTTAEVKVTIDTTAPDEIEITSPSDGMTGDTALSGSSYIFRGNTSDAGVGVEKLRFAFVKADDSFDASVPSVTVWEEQTATDGSWTISRSLAEGTGDPSAGSIKEGHWYLFVKSLDKAGNESEVKNIHFHMDKGYPGLDVTTDGVKDKENGTYYFNNEKDDEGNDTGDTNFDVDSGKYTISATASDTYGIEGITVKVGEDDADDATLSDGIWSYEVPVAADTVTPIIITAVDKAGKTTSKKYTLYRDTKSPEVTVISPANKESINGGSIKLRGTASDVGSGVSSIGYIVKKGNTEIDSDSGIAPVGESWSVVTPIELGDEEGTFTVTVYAVDKVSNTNDDTDSESLKSRTNEFYVDKAYPSIVETGIKDTSKTVNAGFTLSGFVYDSNALDPDAAVTIAADSNDFTTKVFKLSELSPATAEELAAAEITATTTTGWYKWEKSFAVGETNVTNPNYLHDGTYVFTITTKDIASKEKAVQRSVTIDTTEPAVGTVTISSAVVNGSDKYIKGNSVNIEVEASDTGVGVNSVVFTLNGKKSGDDATEPATATEDVNNRWIYRLALGDWDEGDLSVTATITDKAGNEVTTPTAATFKVDKAKPTISEITVKVGDTEAMTEWLKGNFTLSGTVSDSLAVAKDGFSLTIKKQDSADSGKISNDDVTFSEETDTGYSWEYTYSIGDVESGTYEITVEASDKSGQSPDPVTKTVRIDKSSPEVIITSPDNSATPSYNKTGEGSLSGDSYTFRGESSDTGSGIAKIKYAFVKAKTDEFGTDVDPENPDYINPATPDIPVSWNEPAATDGSWSITRSLAEGTGTLAENSLNEGHWYLFVKAVDKAGNESTESKIHFHVDKASPTLTVSNADVAAKENGTYYFANDNSGYNGTTEEFTLAGTVSDSYGLKSVSITIKADGDNAETTPLTVTSSSWTYDVPAPANKAVAVTITATDNSDKIVTKRYTLYRDTAAPTATISSPAQGESFITKPETLTGTVSDVGSGVGTVSYVVKKGEEPKASGDATITGASWTANDVDIGEGEGTFTLTVTTKDKLNNEGTKEATFFVDKANPTLNETGVGTGGKTSNEAFSLSGWVYDSNALPAEGTVVTISSDKNGFSNVELAISNMTEATDADLDAIKEIDNEVQSVTGWYYWTKAFCVPGEVAGQNGVPDDATSLANGTYVFTITAKDVAGKTAVIQRTVKVDTTAPVFSPKTENGNDYFNYTATDTVNGEPWMDKSAVEISVNVDDEANGSGINTVEYETEGGSTGVLRKVGTYWTASVPLSDGENKIRIKATDVAGNVSYYPEPAANNTPNYETILVDTTSPVVTVDSTISAQDYITNVKDISFYLNLTETGSGIASVTATLGSGGTARTITLTSSDYGVIAAAEADTEITVGDGTATATHKITISADALSGLSGSKMLTVKATDNVGNESISVNVANVTIDTQAPTIENLDFKVASGNTSLVHETTDDSADYAYFIKGGTFTITGRTRDNIGIEKTEVKVGSDTAQQVAEDGSGWYINIDPTESTTVTVTATDKAGNEAIKTIKLIFDTTAPAALHIIDSNTKDLVFRVGNYNNDSRSDGPAWDSSLDEDVGGKYSSETFGNTLSITLRGYYKDEGSGLRRIYYKFYNTEYINLTDSQILALIDDVVDAKQTIEPLTEPATKRVFYKVANGATNPVATGSTLYTAATDTKPAEYYTEIPTNFIKEALGNRDLHAGKNYLVLVAEDNVGNKVVDSAVVPIQNNDGTTTINTYYNYVLNVDTTAPSVPNVTSITYNGATKALNEGQNLIVNKSLMGDDGTIDITLTAEDGDEGSGVQSSGIKSVELTKLGNNPLSYKDSNNGDDTYTVSIPKADVTSGAVSVRITDKAGNAADFILFSITNDDTAPGVTLTSHSNENDTTPIVNKTITLKGTAEDTNGVDPNFIGVYFTRSALSKPENNTTPTGTNASSEWVPYTSANQSGSNSWSIEVDTEDAGFTDGYDHYFTVAVKDKAGNTGYSAPVKLKIDQSSDIPVITLRNVSTSGTDTLKNVTEIYGAVTDDDGNISTIDISQDRGANWTPVSVQNGSWTYNVTGDDGAKELYFKVTDPENRVFATNRYGNTQSTPVEDVYIQSGTLDKITDSLRFSVDTNPPEIKAAEITIKGNGENTESQFQNNRLMGGKNTSFELKVPVDDANGINSVYISIGDNDPIYGEILTQTPDKPEGCGTWKISNVDISGDNYIDGYQSAVITVEDTSSVTSSITRQVLIDKTDPTVEVQSHSIGEIVTGLITLKGLTDDGTDASGIDNIKWMIPEALSAASITEDSIGWNDVTSGSIQWNIAFTTDASALKNYANSTYGTEIKEDGVGTNVWQVPVYLRIEDKAGNAFVYKDFYFSVDPDGDKPKVTVTYPTVGADGSDPVLGGTIRISGTAEDNVSVKAVYMQIDVDNNGSFDNDKTNSALGSGENGGHYTIYEEEASDKNNNQAWWGIKVTGTRSWYQNINAYKEFNPTEEGGKRTIKVRFRAVDNNDLCGSWSAPLTIKVDATAPRIGSSEPLKLVQYANADGTGSIVAVQDYQTDMWIKGKWWLTGSVEDENNITECKLENINLHNVTIPLEKEAKTFGSGSSETFGYSFKIPIDTTEFDNGNTTVSFKISATDGSDPVQTATQTISLKYDNTAPEIGALKHGDSTIGNGTNNTVIIEQSNKTYSIEGTATDNGSGFYRMAVYFKRTDTNGSYPRIYNPALPKDGDQNRTYINASQTNGGVSEVDGLPQLYVSSVTRPNEETLVVASGNKNIRVGGLVKIGGVYRLISEVTQTDSQTTVKFTPSVSQDYKEAWFVFALIIDNFKVETPQYYESGANVGKLKEISNDDKDWVIESIEKSGGSYNWSVAIDSKMIPDGPIDICCVAFDEAGNFRSGTDVSTSVQNNRPAIAKIWLGTDYNGSGNIDYNPLDAHDPKNEKIVIFSADQSETNWQKKQENTQVVVDVTDPDKHFNFKAVGKTVIEPEIVGGNGALYYYTAKNSDTTYTGKTLLRATENAAIQPITLDVTDAGSAQAKLSGLGNGNHTFKFKIWDSTENSIVGDTEANNTSQWASIDVKFKVDVVDEVAPAALIKPFFWNGNGYGNNSVYGTTADKADNSSYGHIELEADWQNAAGYDPDATSGEYDGDPKVSGIIRIIGMAYDETRLSSINVSVGGFSLAGGTVGGSTKLARYVNGNWQYTSNGTDWSTSVVDALESAGWKFSVTDNKGITSDGHEVTWELDLDTSFYKVSDTRKYAGKDSAINVVVYDGFNNPSKSGVTQITTFSGTPDVVASAAIGNAETVEWHNDTGVSTITTVTADGTNQMTVETTATPHYRMDIVPYITEIKTALSNLKKGNPSVYARTALGHYAVASNEVLTIQGFNISGGLLKFKKTETATVTASYNESSAGYKIPSTAISGNMSITVNNIESLNNKNNNQAYGTAYDTAPSIDAIGTVYKDKKFYNRQPNGDNNNLLTDDIELDVWQINSQAAKPKSGPLSQPVMAISPTKKWIGFAFANGPLHFSMGSPDKSYEVWEQGLDFWTSIGFAYDANGNSFGTTAGGDINGDPSADAFGIFTSRWGKGLTNNKGGHNNGTGQLRIELVGQAESSNGTSWNGNNINKQRIKSPSIATTVASSDAPDTNVYLAYYDEINDEIRFKWGIFSNGDNTTGRSQNNLFYDYYGPKNGDGAKDSDSNTVSLTETKKVIDLPYTLEYVSLIAGQTKNKWTRIKTGTTTWGDSYKADTAVKTREGNSVYAGQYVSIAAKYQGGDTYNIGTEEEPEYFTDDLVVAVWYDATNNQMLYSYNTAPQKITAPTFMGDNTYRKNDDGTSTGIDSFSQSATGWSTPVAVFGEGNGIGEYCKVVLDAQGKVHIACYDNSNADVWYAYISDATNPSTANIKTCIVDSYGIVGTELSLDVALKEGNPIPYISYYGSSCARPKVAYWAADDSIATITSREGAVDEAFTKNWEVSLIPSGSKISIDHVNVGVWKDASGNLTDSKKPDGTIGSTSSGTSDGTIYGNGTMNPILGYAITQGSGGYIETAQMK